MRKRLWMTVLLVALSVLFALPGSAQPAARVSVASGDAVPARELAADPTFLWNTFLGGSQWDDGYAVAVDGNRNVYVAGVSQGSWGSPLRSYGGAGDAFVAKLNRNGVLQWNTFLGSATGEDEAYAIALDGNGNIDVSGRSTVSWGSPIHPHSGNGSDLFVAQLGKNGVLKWNTFYGAYSDDVGYALAVDGTNSIYVAGESYSNWGSPVNPPSSLVTDQEAFVAKFNTNGALQWNTFLGAAGGADYAKGIAVGASVVVAGHSRGSWGVPVRAHSGDAYGDAFVAQLDSSSGARQWNTFLGGAATDEGFAVGLSGATAYVTGYSYATWGAPVDPFPGNSENAFVACLSGSGALQWNTFLGGGDYEDDRGQAISVARGGRIYVAGQSSDTWGTPVNPHADDWDAFVARLNTSGDLLWNTFLGGDDNDYGFAIASDDANVYVVGESYVTYDDWGMPVRSGSDSYDAFAVRLGVEPPELHQILLPVILRH